MTYRSLLVHLADDERCGARVDLAAQLAHDFDARLTGLAPTGRVLLSPDLGPGLLGLDTMTLLVADLRHQASERAEAFRQQCRRRGATSFEAVVDEDDVRTSLLTRAESADLLVLGQSEPDSQHQSVLEEVLMRSPRPTLLVPHAGRFDTIGRHVLVAWDGGRESARAMSDALPLLARADRVQVVHLLGKGDDDGREALLRPRLDALHGWLMGHGVDAQVRVEATGIDAGNALLSMAADQGVDLLVTGAYGHSRWSERMLGGATRTLLQSMTVPVLMSH